MSPPRARLARAFSSSASSSLPPLTLPKYCVRTSCASIITSPLSWLVRISAFARPRWQADYLRCSSSCRRVRSPDPWASVGYEAFQDAGVEAGCDVPAPPARAIQLEEPPLAHFGHGRLFEGSQAARRQRPHVDLLLGFAYGDQRGIGPEGAPPLARLSLCLSAHLRSPTLPHRLPTFVPTLLLYALRAVRRRPPRVALAAAPSTSRRIQGTRTSRRSEGRCACSRQGGPPRRRLPRRGQRSRRTHPLRGPTRKTPDPLARLLAGEL